MNNNIYPSLNRNVGNGYTQLSIQKANSAKYTNMVPEKKKMKIVLKSERR